MLNCINGRVKKWKREVCEDGIRYYEVQKSVYETEGVGDVIITKQSREDIKKHIEITLAIINTWV